MKVVIDQQEISQKHAILQPLSPQQKQNLLNAFYEQQQNKENNKIEEPVFSLSELKEIIFKNGIPDEPAFMRPFLYTYLLGYRKIEVTDKEDSHHYQLLRRRYWEFLNEFFETVMPEQQLKEINTEMKEQEEYQQRFPDEQQQQHFFQDSDLFIFEQIDKDVKRTFSDFSFFQEQTPIDPLQTVAYPFSAQESDETLLLGFNKKERSRLYQLSRTIFAKLKDFQEDSGYRSHVSPIESPKFEFGIDYHWEVIERILFIYARLNKAIGYVQGMNEILAPIYFTLAKDSQDKEFAEADAFWLFSNLMAEVKDLYLASMDDDQKSGMSHSLNMLDQLLLHKDLALYLHLEQEGVHSVYYGFRWFSLLMVQDFHLPELLRIWDTLFSDSFRFDFLICLASAMVISIREEILNSDFQDILYLLQNYPKDLEQVLPLAYEIYDQEVGGILRKTIIGKTIEQVEEEAQALVNEEEKQPLWKSFIDFLKNDFSL